MAALSGGSKRLPEAIQGAFVLSAGAPSLPAFRTCLGSIPNAGLLPGAACKEPIDLLH
jgi:hypothetical protein